MPASRKEREQEPMAPMSEDQLRKARLKARDAMMRLALWKLREMRDKYVGRPRTTRLAKSLRAQIAAAGHRAGGAQDSRAGGAQNESCRRRANESCRRHASETCRRRANETCRRRALNMCRRRASIGRPAASTGCNGKRKRPLAEQRAFHLRVQRSRRLIRRAPRG